MDISEVDYARDIQLPDHNGQQRSLKDFKGKVAVVFFGYTQCPDVCPTTMQEMAEVKRMLGKDGDRLQAIFVTVGTSCAAARRAPDTGARPPEPAGRPWPTAPRPA